MTKQIERFKNMDEMTRRLGLLGVSGDTPLMWVTMVLAERCNDLEARLEKLERLVGVPGGGGQ